MHWTFFVSWYLFFLDFFEFLQSNKMEISLPNPSSLGNQQPVGVIVKYDTSHKLNPIQLTHSNVEKVIHVTVVDNFHKLIFEFWIFQCPL